MARPKSTHPLRLKTLFCKIPSDDDETTKRLAFARSVSQAEIIRQAIKEYLQNHHEEIEKEIKERFGR